MGIVTTSDVRYRSSCEIYTIYSSVYSFNRDDAGCVKERFLGGAKKTISQVQ